MTNIKEFFKKPNVRKWISDVIKIGVGVCLGGVLFSISLYFLMYVERFIR